MKLAIIAAAVIALAACAATREAQNATGTIRTGSVIYDAGYAAKAGINQAQTAECERQARVVWSNTVGNTAFGQGNNNTACLAFEACIDKMARR